MYENPKLTRVGEAQKVVLGQDPGGHDIDLNWLIMDSEFAEEEDADSFSGTT